VIATRVAFTRYGGHSFHDVTSCCRLLQKNINVRCVTVDFSEGFDTANHPTVIQKLNWTSIVIYSTESFFLSNGNNSLKFVSRYSNVIAI
jgi:hypothetical protein